MNPGQGEAAQRPSDEGKDKELASTSFAQVTKYKAVSFNLLSLSKAIESELQREPVRWEFIGNTFYDGELRCKLCCVHVRM
jgi:hypothetical protein